MNRAIESRADEKKDADVQEGSSAVSGMFVAIFSVILKLYPRHFYDTFADEMCEVFALAIANVAHQGSLATSRILLRELIELPVSVLREHIHNYRRTKMNVMELNTTGHIRLARWVARGFSLLISGFVLSQILLNEDVRAEPTSPFWLLAVLSLFMLLAWRWEKEGGLLILAGAPILSTVILTRNLSVEGLITPVINLVGVSLAMLLAFWTIGWLFLSVARHTKLEAFSGDEANVTISANRSHRIYAAIIGVGLLALILLAIPSLVPVRQEFDFEAGLPEATTSEDVINQLRLEGAVVGTGSIPAEQDFLAVSGLMLDVDGAIVELYEYPDIESATADASAIYYGEVSGWNAETRLYQVSNVLVWYGGDSPVIRDLLDATFGFSIQPEH